MADMWGCCMTAWRWLTGQAASDRRLEHHRAVTREASAAARNLAAQVAGYDTERLRKVFGEIDGKGSGGSDSAQ